MKKAYKQYVINLNDETGENELVNLEEFYKQQEMDAPISYINDTFIGVCAHWDDINGMIEPALANWSMKRLNAVCLAILRLATYELKFNSDIPDRVAVNEAIELAKEFGEEDSGSFVHGVLSAISKN